ARAAHHADLAAGALSPPPQAGRHDIDRSYDVIVSGLPFTNFTPVQVETVMNRYLELLHPGGTLTYFAYRGTRYARALAAPTEARRHRAVEELLAHYHRRYAIGCWSVWGNLPPARVWQLRRPETNGHLAARTLR
ncbi:translation initiation factor IF-2, partial [Streptomyces sp. NPDC006324]